MAVRITHSTVTGAPADPTSLVDGPAWDEDHVVTGLEVIFVYEGDSLTNTAINGTWPTKLAALSAFFSRGDTYNFALSSDTAALMVGEYATQAGAINLAPYGEKYYFLWAGTNDLTAGTSAATTYGYLTTMWAAARASGYKVIAFTIMPNAAHTSGQNDARIALNSLILSDPSFYDFIVRPDVYFTNTADQVNFLSTGVHLTPAGNLRLAQKVAAVVLGTAPLYAAPFDAMSYSGIQVNGSMDGSLENGSTAVASLDTTAATVNGKYIVDGFKVAIVGTSVLTAQQVSDAPPGLANSLKLSVTTAEASIASGSLVAIRTPIEGYRTSRLAFGTLNAQPVSIGFWTKAHRIGAYSGAIVNSAGDRAYPFSFTQNVSDIWEFKTVTAPGDVTGTWIGNTNGKGLELFITVAAGSTFVGTENAWAASNLLGVTGTTNGVAATSDVFQITGVIVLPGIELPNAQSMPRIMRSLDLELPILKRYFEKSFLLATNPAQAIGTSTGEYCFPIMVAGATQQRTVSWPFSVPKRITPTMTGFNPASANAFIRDETAAADFSSANFATSENMFRIAGTSPAGSAVGNVAGIHWTANARL